MKSSTFQNTLFNWQIIILSAITILPFVVLIFFSFPALDDFFAANILRENGYWGMMGYYLSGWSTRYTAISLYFLNPLLNGSKSINWILPLLLIILQFLSLKVFIKALFERFEIKTNSLIPTLVIFALYLNSIPGIFEGLYWFSSITMYSLGNILILLFFSILIKSKSDYSLKSGVILFILAILTIGTTEIHAILLVEILVFKLFQMKNNYEKRSVKSLIILLIISLLIISVQILLPANANRSAIFTLNGNIISLIFISLKYSGYAIGFHLIKPAFFIFLIICFFLGRFESGNKHNIKLKKLLIHLIIIVLNVIFFISLHFFVLGTHPPLRFVNVITLGLILSGGWLIFLVGNKFKFRKNPSNYLLINGLIILFFASFPFNQSFNPASKKIQLQGNCLISWNDLIFKAKDFSNQMKDRQNQIKKSKLENTHSVEFKPITNPPITLFTKDLETDSLFWYNMAYAKFYRLQSVNLKSP